MLDLAFKNLKINNLIENKERNLKKFIKAKENNPDLPFIPKSASSFTLNGTDAAKGSKDFELLQLKYSKLTETYNKKISELCFEVGLLEKKALVENRTTSFLKKGLTLSYAMQIFSAHEHGLKDPVQPKKVAAYTLFGTILGSIKLMEFVKLSQNDLCKSIEDEFKTYHGLLNLRNLDSTICDNDKRVAHEVIRQLTEPLCLVTVNTWKHLLKNQEERRRKLEMLIGIQELKLNSATEATEKLLDEEQKVSHKVLSDLINAKVEEKLKLKKKRMRRQSQKNSLGEGKTQPSKPKKTGSILKSKKTGKEEKKNVGKNIEKKVRFREQTKTVKNRDAVNKDGDKNRKGKKNTKSNKAKTNLPKKKK